MSCQQVEEEDRARVAPRVDPRLARAINSAKAVYLQSKAPLVELVDAAIVGAELNNRLTPMLTLLEAIEAAGMDGDAVKEARAGLDACVKIANAQCGRWT